MPSQIYVHPRTFWENHNGRPQAGGKLYFYESGTSTPKTVYADDDLTTPLTNPVVATSAGVWPAIHLSGTYKVVLTDADDVTIWTEDPVAFGLIGDGSNILVTADGTPTPRRLGERFAEEINVLDFAADGGTTSAALLAGTASAAQYQATAEAWAAYVNARVLPWKGIFPACNWLTTGPITITASYGTIDGHGCQLINEAGDDGRFFQIGTDDIAPQWLTIRNFGLQIPDAAGNSSLTAEMYAVDVVAGAHITLESFFVQRLVGSFRCGGRRLVQRFTVTNWLGNARGDVANQRWVWLRNGSVFEIINFAMNGAGALGYDFSVGDCFFAIQPDHPGFDVQNLGGDPVTTYSGERYVDITVPAHGAPIYTGAPGTRAWFTFTGLTAVGGIPAVELNVTDVRVEAQDSDTIRVYTTHAATSSTTGGGSAGTAEQIGHPLIDTVNVNNTHMQAFQPGPIARRESVTRSGDEFTSGGTTVTATFSEVVASAAYLLIVVNGAGEPKSYFDSITGYGTDTLTFVKSGGVSASDQFSFDRVYYPSRAQMPRGLVIDSSKGATVNMWFSNCNWDHTTDAGILITDGGVGTSAPFVRNLNFTTIRATSDDGNAVRIALTSPGTANRDITFLGGYLTQAGNDYGIDCEVLGSVGVLFGFVNVGEARNNPGVFSRRANCRFKGDNIETIGCIFGSFTGDEESSAGLAQAAIFIDDPYVQHFNHTANTCGSNVGPPVFAEQPSYLDRTVALGTDPVSTLEIDTDHDGTPDGFANQVAVSLTAHGLFVGDQIEFTGLTGGNGVTADQLNRVWTVAATPTLNIFRVNMAPVWGDDGNPITAAGAIGGAGGSVKIYRRGYIQSEVTGTDILAATNGDATIVVTAQGHSCQTGDIALVSVTAGGVGLTTGDLEGARPITVIDNNSYSFEADAAATGTDDIGGDVTVQVWVERRRNPNRVMEANTPAEGEGTEVLRLRRLDAAGLATSHRLVLTDTVGDQYSTSLDDIATLTATDIGFSGGILAPSHGGTGEGNLTDARTAMGAVPTSRIVSASGLASGGGNLSIDRTISVLEATASQMWNANSSVQAVTPTIINTMETPTALTPGPTLVIGQGVGRNFEATLDQNSTLGPLNNAKPGTSGFIWVNHNGYTLSFNAAWLAEGGSLSSGTGVCLYVYAVKDASTYTIKLAYSDIS